MDKENVLEVLKKLVGNINPVADSAIDRERFENLKLFLEVFEEMHTMIDDISHAWRDTPYGSVKPFVDACNKQLENFKEQ